ncbi:MAG: iron-containing alcohol dehydrogenase family protein [Candidatus Margulisiibacteriota bacterium]|jgi:glycerol-1-phosphate dehydrogenase [NAD(P)+]
MEITIPSLLRIKPKALNKVGKYLRHENFSNIALFLGEGIKELFFEKIAISLDSSEIKIVHEEIINSNDINEIFKSSLSLPKRTEAVLAIGGGKALDFCKYVAFINQLPLVVVPTIISNDAFCSPFSSLLIDGKRKTVKTAIPHGIIVDTEIISNSPPSFIFSGIGDLFCKATSLFDWKLAFAKTHERIDDFAKVITQQSLDTFYYYENKDIKNLEFLRILTSSLLMSGIAMLIAKSSRPASGSEHLISHAYDRIAAKPSLHGLQVGVASYAVSFLQVETYEKVKNMLIESKFLDFMTQNPLNKADFQEAIKLAPSIKDDYYTILSEKNNIERLLQFLDEDELINKMLIG